MQDVVFEKSANPAAARPPAPALPRQNPDFWRKLFAPLKAVKQLADAVQPFRDGTAKLTGLRTWFRNASTSELPRLETRAAETLDAEDVLAYLRAHQLFRNDAAALEFQHLLRRMELKLTAKTLDTQRVTACAIAALQAAIEIVAELLGEARKAEVTRLREHGIDGEASPSPVVLAIESKRDSLLRLKSELENGTVSKVFNTLQSELTL